MEHYIEDNLHYKIQDYCEFNHLDMNEYINDCIVKQFNIDRYGDLNDIIGNNKENKQDGKEFFIKEMKYDEKKQSFVIKHNLGDDILIPLMNILEINNNLFQTNKEEIKTTKENTLPIEEIKEKEFDTNKKRKRTLKTK